MAAMKNLFFGKRSPDILGISGLRFREQYHTLNHQGATTTGVWMLILPPN